jgi:hypothetical protein
LLHRHAVEELLPAADIELSAHGGQAAEPKAFLYVPSAHRVHAHAGPVEPGAQSATQSEATTLPGLALNPSGHCAHVAELIAPVTCEYLPTSQSSQKDLPPEEYFPAAHTMHVLVEAAPEAAENVPATQAVHVSGPE